MIMRKPSNPLLSKSWPKLVILEGIMGSGKTTNTLRLADKLNACGCSAIGITEGASPHPIRFDWDVPWSEMPPAQLAKSATTRWKAYADRARVLDAISVVDGQLFHGNLTSLFLLEADTRLMHDYINEITATIRPLDPLLIYFQHTDIDQAIRSIAAERGSAWVQYQFEWKLASPYARRRDLNGLEGLITLYRDYRALTDRLYVEVTFPKFAIEDAQKDWENCEAMIDRVVANKDTIN